MRSTKVYCCDACRVKAGRHRPVKTARPKLAARQYRILQALVKLSPQAGMTCAKLGEKTGISVGNMSDLLGKVRPDRRVERERMTGRPSLLTLGYVSTAILQSDEKGPRQRIFRIAWDKRELVKRLLAAKPTQPHPVTEMGGDGAPTELDSPTG